MGKGTQNSLLGPLLRTISVVVVVIFTTTSVAWAGGVNVLEVAIPKKFGEVKERYQGKGDKVVVHIQDAHASLDAQKNISKIIQRLVKSQDVQVVGVEGAEGELDTTDISSYPRKQLLKRVSYEYLKQGKITGSEYESIVSGDSFDFYGVDDRTAYEENYSAFQNVFRVQEKLSTHLEEIKAALTKLKKEFFSAGLLELDELAGAYQAEEISFPEYAKEVLRIATDQQIDLTRFINVMSLHDVVKHQSQADPERIKEEINKLIDILNNEHVDEKKRFDRIEEDYKNKKISEKEYFAYLASLPALLSLEGVELSNVIQQDHRKSF